MTLKPTVITSRSALITYVFKHKCFVTAKLDYIVKPYVYFSVMCLRWFPILTASHEWAADTNYLKNKTHNAPIEESLHSQKIQFI